MYTIKKSNSKITDINDKSWDMAEIAEVNCINWKEFSWKPNTYARVLYSDYGLHIKLVTDEQNLFVSRREQNSDVSKDSCMEFFIRPCMSDERYLNFEINPFGTMYLGVRYNRDNKELIALPREYFDVQSVVSDKEWVVAFNIPFEFIDKIFGVHDDKMLGNIYKCGEDTEIEHYVTYYPISSAEPDFHRPECFREFVLEKE